MGAYHRGQSVRLTCAFTDAAGASANPTTVTCKVEKPDGTETTYTSASTPAVANTATGTYQLVLSANQSGMWSYRWEGVTGTTTPVDEGTLTILKSVFS